MAVVPFHRISLFPSVERGGMDVIDHGGDQRRTMKREETGSGAPERHGSIPLLTTLQY